jgi:hypothetical protein
VFSTSTKGTWAMTTRKRSGRILATAPMSKPREALAGRGFGGMLPT